MQNKPSHPPFVEQGKKLRDARDAARLNQIQVLNAIGIFPKNANPGRLGNWEAGRNAPHKKYWGALSKALRLDVAALYTGQEPRQLKSGINGPVIPVKAIRPILDSIKGNLLALELMCGNRPPNKVLRKAGYSAKGKKQPTE